MVELLDVISQKYLTATEAQHATNDIALGDEAVLCIALLTNYLHPGTRV